MRCRECVEFLADYIAEELPVSTRETFDSHLEVCDNCRVFLIQYRETIVAERAAFSAESTTTIALPEDLVRAILKALDKTK